MDIPNNWVSSLQKAYESFIMRDFTYFIGGGIVISTIDICVNNEYVFMGYAVKSVINMIIFMALSYSFGFIIKEASCLKTKRLGHDRVFDHTKLQPLIKKKYGESMTHFIERTIFIAHLSISITSNCSVSLVIVVAKIILFDASHVLNNNNNAFNLWNIVLLGVGLLFLSIISYLEYRLKCRQYKAYYDVFFKEFTDDIINDFYGKQFESSL